MRHTEIEKERNLVAYVTAQERERKQETEKQRESETLMLHTHTAHTLTLHTLSHYSHTYIHTQREQQQLAGTDC